MQQHTVKQNADEKQLEAVRLAINEQSHSRKKKRHTVRKRPRACAWRALGLLTDSHQSPPEQDELNELDSIVAQMRENVRGKSRCLSLGSEQASDLA